MSDRGDLVRVTRKAVLAVGLAALIASLAAPVAGANAVTKRSSVKATAIQAKGRSEEPSISNNGRYIAFHSNASNLVKNDNNGVDDCFIRDEYKKQTSIVSVASSGVRGNGWCMGPALSGDGRFVAFESMASNLVSGDTNGTSDIFVRDLINKVTVRVSVSTAGDQANGASSDPAISENGRYVVFESIANTLIGSDTNGASDVFLHDRVTGTTTRVSVGSGGQGNNGSFDPAISANGGFVVFESRATNLVGNDNNGEIDVFIRDVAKGQTGRVNVRSNGYQARGGPSGNPTVSGTGRFVVFDSLAKNLVNGDTNRASDVFIRDRLTRKTKRVSIRSGGGQANAWSFDPTISKNGRYIAFSSDASNIVRNDTNRKTDGFVRDRLTKKVRKVSVPAGGGQARGKSDDMAISGDGRFVAFESLAPNLVNRDTNKKKDIFRRGRLY
jgi:Tol biopolymer transport system component